MSNLNYSIRRCSCALAALALSAMQAAAVPLDAKLGLWETVITTETAGSIIPKATLEKLPPEQRAKMEAMMKEHAAKGPQTQTYKSCVKKEDLDSAAFADQEDKSCKYTFTTQSSTKQEGTFKCSGDDLRSGQIRVEVTSRDKMKGAMQVITPNGKVTMQMNGRWLAADCKGQ